MPAPTYEIAYTVNLPGHHTHGEKRTFRGGKCGIANQEAAATLADIFKMQDDMADVAIVTIPAGWSHV
jgi:hypothetical protein